MQFKKYNFDVVNNDNFHGGKDMKKKWRNGALLVTATFMLMAFFACSADDTSDDDKKTGFVINFVGMEASAFGLESFEAPQTSLPEGFTKVIGTNATATLYETYSGVNKNNPMLKVRNADGKATGINYGRCDIGALNVESLEEDVVRYISVPVNRAGTLTVMYRGNNSTDDIPNPDDNHLQVALVDENNKVLAWQGVPVYNVPETAVRALSASIPKAATVRFVFSSNGTVKTVNGVLDPDKLTGSLDVFSITFLPAH